MKNLIFNQGGKVRLGKEAIVRGKVRLGATSE